MKMKKYLEIPTAREVYDFVLAIHADQPYGDLPYSHHLFGVYDVHVAADMDDLDSFLISMAHDSIEDVVKNRREEVIEFLRQRLSDHAFTTVWAMTGIGHNRKTRNANYYGKIGVYTRAADHKLADRIINFESSRDGHPEKFQMYQREDAAFEEHVVSLATNQYLIDRYRAVARG